MLLTKSYPRAFRLMTTSIQGLNNSTATPTPISNSDVSPQEDYRKIALHKFLNTYASPLVSQVDVLIREADANGIDYALIPAIAMQESQGCKVLPYDSYNCWGYGIYGNKITRFSSYAQAITRVAKTIKETYIKNGLTNPTLLEDRWAPSSRGLWSYSVNFFISKLREFERNIPDT